MDGMLLPTIVGIIGVLVGFIIAKSLEKAKEKKLLNTTKKRSYFNYKRSKNRCRIY